MVEVLLVVDSRDQFELDFHSGSMHSILSFYLNSRRVNVNTFFFKYFFISFRFFVLFLQQIPENDTQQNNQSDMMVPHKFIGTV